MTNYNKAEIEEFSEDVNPFGSSHLEFCLYSVRSPKAKAFESPNLSNWPDQSSASHFILYDEDWPINEGWPIIVELFTIKTQQLPKDLEICLSAALVDLIQQGSTVSYYLFEGAFGGIQPLFDAWVIKNAYGIAVPRQEPHLAITKRSRQQESWQEIFEEALRYVHRQHLNLSNFVPRTD